MVRSNISELEPNYFKDGIYDNFNRLGYTGNMPSSLLNDYFEILYSDKACKSFDGFIRGCTAWH